MNKSAGRRDDLLVDWVKKVWNGGGSEVKSGYFEGQEIGFRSCGFCDLTTSGLSCITANCFSMDSPPSTHAARSPVYLPSSRVNLSVCSASSLVGENTIALNVWIKK